MSKPLVYSGFIIACLMEMAIFFTTRTYVQLGIAVVIYPLLVYFALKLFPRKNAIEDEDDEPNLAVRPSPEAPIDESDKEGVDEDVKVIDIDRRAFLKLIGETGLTVFLSSLFSRKAGNLLLGKEGEGVTTIQDTAGEKINPAKHQPTDDYRISEVDYGVCSFYGFINGTNSWYIMKEDISAGTFRYVKGNVNFSDNWNNRERLSYDHYNRVFPA